MRIVLIHACIQHILLLVCKRRAFGLQGVEDNLRHNLLVVIVRECDARSGKMQPVPVLISGNAHQLGDVPVGYVVHAVHFLHELVTVLDNHQLVPSHQSVLLELHCRTDSCVVFVCPSVGTAQHDSLILPVFGIRIRYLLYQLASSDPLHIVKTVCAELQPGHSACRQICLYHVP